MKAFKNIAVFGGIFVSGILSSYLGLMPTVAVITLVVGLVIIFTDYEKATLIAALYTAFEFVLRSVIGRPGSQILSMFGKRVYFDFIQKAIESPTAFSSYWDELALLFCFGVWHNASSIKDTLKEMKPCLEQKVLEAIELTLSPLKQ
jgi:uncharacterized membrane protein